MRGVERIRKGKDGKMEAFKKKNSRICKGAITVAADSPASAALSSSTRRAPATRRKQATPEKLVPRRIFPKTEISLSAISLLFDDPVLNGSSSRDKKFSLYPCFAFR